MSGFIRPTIRPAETISDRVILQVGGLGVNISFSELGDGIVQLIEQFGSTLYYGYPKKEIFLNYFYSHKRYSLIQELKNFDPHTEISENNLNNLGLYLYMARAAQSQKWKYPALLTRQPNGELHQATGGTRAFASGLTKPEPWKHFPILILEDINRDVGAILEDPVRVTSDQQLTEILGGVYDREIWDPTVRLVVDLKKSNAGHPYFVLKHVDDYSYVENNKYRGEEYLKKFQDWKLKNPNRPNIKIYTNYPENIKDLQAVWRWEIAGDTGNFETLMGEKVGWVERLARRYHTEDKQHGEDYVLWLIKDRIVELGDLLPWMDNQYTSYISSDWAFVLYRPDEIFKSTFIDVSYQE
jgi:hypothetical protein